MTKKKFLAALSTAAITTSLLATTAFASTPEWNNNGGQTTGEGNGTVRVPVIEVEVPLELPFAVNPYKLNLAEEGQTAITDQIYSDNYMIINHSEVPVAVKTASKATAGSDVTLETAVKFDANTGKHVGADATKKNAFLGMQFAKTITFASDAYAVTYDTWTPADADAATALQAKGGLLLSATDEEATVVLGTEAVETDVAKGVNAAAFKYVGVVNDSTTAAYTDEDLKVTTVYTLSVLASDDITVTSNAISAVKGYDATTATDNAGTALNTYKIKATAGP